jgi:hypothetical protein
MYVQRMSEARALPERLEEFEDAYWSRRAADVLANGEPTVSWDEAVALLESGE